MNERKVSFQGIMYNGQQNEVALGGGGLDNLTNFTEKNNRIGVSPYIQ